MNLLITELERLCLLWRTPARQSLIWDRAPKQVLDSSLPIKDIPEASRTLWLFWESMTQRTSLNN
jgi:hypothetical protein